MNTFNWKDFSQNKIFSVLAPMEEVSDTAFRQLLIQIGRPDIFFTEFTSIDGMFSKGRDNVLQRFKYDKNELPLIAQIWGKDISLYSKAVKLIIEKGFSGVDVNMGCPDKDVVKCEAGAALINNPDKVKSIIDSVREVDDKYPLSIKTRLGFNEENINWIEFLLTLKIDALSIHLRTAKAKSSGLPNYEIMMDISKLRDEISPNTVLICNGDIKSIQQGEDLCKSTGFNGYMIGREAVNNPYVFKGLNRNEFNKSMRIKLALKHTQIFEKKWNKEKNFNILKKFYVRYISNFEGAQELRTKLMETKSYADVYNLLTRISL